jgi:hypothetical protein
MLRVGVVALLLVGEVVGQFEVRGQFEVLVRYANNIPNFDTALVDASDPFVIVYDPTGRECGRTTIISDDPDPVWNERVSCGCIDPRAGTGMARIDLLDSDWTGDDLLGSYNANTDSVFGRVVTWNNGMSLTYNSYWTTASHCPSPPSPSPPPLPPPEKALNTCKNVLVLMLTDTCDDRCADVYTSNSGDEYFKTPKFMSSCECSSGVDFNLYQRWTGDTPHSEFLYFSCDTGQWGTSVEPSMQPEHKMMGEFRPITECGSWRACPGLTKDGISGVCPYKPEDTAGCSLADSIAAAGGGYINLGASVGGAVGVLLLLCCVIAYCVKEKQRAQAPVITSIPAQMVGTEMQQPHVRLQEEAQQAAPMPMPPTAEGVKVVETPPPH